MYRILCATAIPVATALFAALPAAATPVQWLSASGGNDHFYDVIMDAGCTWTQARDAASVSFFAGSPGHLATITSHAENDFLVASFRIPGSPDTVWIGASDVVVEGVWLWVTGEVAGTQFWQGGVAGSATPPFNYANWGHTEPNNIPNEDFACWALDTFDGLWSTPGRWADANDAGVNARVTGYVVEYSGTVIDRDEDGHLDTDDNCIMQPNPAQTDADGDGIGNLCDQDLNNDCIVNAIDLGLLKSVFFTSDATADFNADGAVNAIDLGLMKGSFFGRPGPSGIANGCPPGC